MLPVLVDIYGQVVHALVFGHVSAVGVMGARFVEESVSIGHRRRMHDVLVRYA